MISPYRRLNASFASMALCLSMSPIAHATAAQPQQTFRETQRIATPVKTGDGIYVQGYARIGAGPGRGTVLVGGLVIWLAASWAHIPLAGYAAGVWRWVH